MPVKTLNYQKGVVRNNCVDCLDRTNVVQSIIGRTNLLAILHKNNIIFRDLKPENMFYFDNRRKVKLIDFGSCFMIGEPEIYIDDDPKRK